MRFDCSDYRVVATLSRDPAGESRPGVEGSFELGSLLGRHRIESSAIAAAEPFHESFVEFVHAFTFSYTLNARMLLA
jgi:hypothetical protein